MAAASKSSWVARKPSWGETEFYEALCLMMIGFCCWFVGSQLGAFRFLDRLIDRHSLADVAIPGFLMGCGAIAGSIRKSLQLRRAMIARDKAEAEAAAVARHDTLTGLANRRRFAEGIEQRRAAKAASAVLLIDLDRFKPVNDLHGHAAGDSVLCVVAERLESLLPPGSLAARLGGDEFAALVDAGAGSEALARLAQGIVTVLSAPMPWRTDVLTVGATIGIALVADRDGSAEAVLHAAGLAMDQGKKDGRGTYRVFENAMDDELKARALLERELREAIDAGQIVPFYQPVVSLTTRALTCCEVLARWEHPREGLLPPSAFIAVAEETGMIADLSYKLLRRACLDARTWPAGLQLAINISPQQFQDPHLAAKILAILTDTGFPPSRLEVEITESALVHDLDATRTTLSMLQNVGVRIALDDFGTGYSSLYHLRELRFDKLKIDRSYVNAISMSEDRAQLVDAIIKLGTSLGLVTTAEGIETDTSVDWLENQGCDYGQGYLFGKPMSKNETDRLFAAGMLPLLLDEASSGAAARAA